MYRTARSRIIAACLLLITFCHIGLAATPAGPAPASLRETGLYSDWDKRVVDPRNLAYAPQYPLWTDGAAKQRWIRIPAGTSIDATNADDWKFPVGTKLWKEFSFGRRVETRYMELLENGKWAFATYVWNADGTDATLAPSEGVRNATPISDGVAHDIPGYYNCLACHGNRRNGVLGFNALQLSSDRDPLALHAAPARENLYELPRLIEEGIVQGLPASLQETPPRIFGASATERAALGYLYGNCSHCHNRVGKLSGLELSFDVPLQAVVLPNTVYEQEASPSDSTLVDSYALGAEQEYGATPELAASEPDASPCGTCYEMPALATTVGCEARIGGARSEYRITPGDPSQSALWERFSTRSPAIQMPPLGTEVLDMDALNLIETWILELEPNPQLCSTKPGDSELHASAPLGAR